MSTGVKYDSGKAPMALLPHSSLVEVAKVLEFGAKKYAADNWRAGMQWRRLISAAMRHLGAFADGEDKDPETGLSHLAHAGCCVLFLLEYERTHRELDDRYRVREPDMPTGTVVRQMDGATLLIKSSGGSQ